MTSCAQIQVFGPAIATATLYGLGVRVDPFAVEVSDAVLQDLQKRVRRTRWPDPAPGEPWAQGVDLTYLRGLLEFWADGFDWRSQERWHNHVRSPEV